MGTESTPSEVRQAEGERQLVALLKHPRHPSVAHVNVEAERYIEAARAALAQGSPIKALHLVSVAEGIAAALESVAGLLEGLRENAVHKIALRLRAEIQLEVTRLHPERGTSQQTEGEVEA